MSLPNTTQVLVVGAGPVGLACAITLAHEGLNVTVVDSLTANKGGSRASTMHARTLEVLETIGCSQPLVELGIKALGLSLFDGPAPLLEFNIARSLAGKTSYPHLLLIPQHETERVLREKAEELGIQVLWGNAVSGYRDTEDGLDVIFNGGNAVKTRYLVGADGSRSTVRSLAGIQFKDPQSGFAYDSEESRYGSNANRSVLADLYLAEPVPPNVSRKFMTIHFDQGASIILIPLISPTYDNMGNDDEAYKGQFYRFGVFLRDDEEDPPKEPDAVYIQKVLDSRRVNGTTLKLGKLIRASRYRIRAAIADTFFQPIGGSKILLAGDAAHVHSPVGGQGLNLGICDGVALGRAIAVHSKLPTSDVIFENYSKYRRSVAMKVISVAERITNLSSMASGWRKWVRNVMIFIVNLFPLLRDLTAWRISGLVYRDADRFLSL